MAADCLLWHKQVDGVILVELYTFALSVVEFIVALRIDSIVILCAEKLLCVVVPYLGGRVEFT